LVARSVRDAEAGGSNPPFPTRERGGQECPLDVAARAGNAAIPAALAGASVVACDLTDSP
jgi:2-polyprenyl-3-methyl-5-hydroxy-6-metoxy-1,4-benzoquinol methylase